MIPIHTFSFLLAGVLASPAAGVIVYAYQTGRDGLYAPQNAGAPRLRAWLRTGPQGEFRLETIRPAPYPNDRIPAHIHFQAWGTDVAPQYLEDLLFEDDRLVGETERRRSRGLGPFAFVQPVRAGSATIRLRLKPAGDRMENNILHGLSACRKE
jgi:protocatechuate 3,4-dioxygenase beta subunit